MRPIPLKIRKQLSQDPMMDCCLECGAKNPSWHHPWCYANRQINEPWAIVPLCYNCHQGDGWNSTVEDHAELYSLRQATKEDLAKYPRKDWAQELNRLDKKYPKWKPKNIYTKVVDF